MGLFTAFVEWESSDIVYDIKIVFVVYFMKIMSKVDSKQIKQNKQNKQGNDKKVSTMATKSKTSKNPFVEVTFDAIKKKVGTSTDSSLILEAYNMASNLSELKEEELGRELNNLRESKNSKLIQMLYDAYPEIKELGMRLGEKYGYLSLLKLFGTETDPFSKEAVEFLVNNDRQKEALDYLSAYFVKCSSEKWMKYKPAYNNMPDEWEYVDDKFMKKDVFPQSTVTAYDQYKNLIKGKNDEAIQNVYRQCSLMYRFIHHTPSINFKFDLHKDRYWVERNRLGVELYYINLFQGFLFTYNNRGLFEFIRANQSMEEASKFVTIMPQL